MTKYLKNRDEADHWFIGKAIELAKHASNNNEIPVGALVVINNEIIAEAYNETVSACDPSAHAEVLALRRAAIKMGNHRLLDTTLYVTLEPCLMCCGCLLEARIGRLVFGATEPKTGAVHSTNEALSGAKLSHNVPVTRGIREDECAEVLKQFFKTRR